MQAVKNQSEEIFSSRMSAIPLSAAAPKIPIKIQVAADQNEVERMFFIFFDLLISDLSPVIPARFDHSWIPACVGMAWRVGLVNFNQPAVEEKLV